MVEFVPDWLTFEIEEALREIGGPHMRKKRTTVLRLAEGVVLGRSMAETFRLPETCTETTWYGRYRKGKKRPGWCDDPAIQKALKLATERAQYCSDGYIGRQIQETQKKLAKYGPGAADVLAVLMAKAKSETERRLSAVEILNRAGAGEVASKATVPSVGGEQVVRFDLSELPTEILRRVIDADESGEIEGDGAD